MAVRFLMAPMLLLAVCQAAAQPPAPVDTVGLLVERLEQAVLSGDRARLASLEVPQLLGPGAEAFWRSMAPVPDQIVIKTRDRTPLTDGSEQLLLEIFSVRGQEARVGTWNARVREGGPAATGEPPAWQIVSIERLSTVTGLFRLSLDGTRQYAVSRLQLKAPDLVLDMSSGTAFLATVPGGATAVLLLGQGTMRFTPPDPAERSQMQIFAGAPGLDTAFDLALLRVNPEQFAPVLASPALTPEPLSQGDLRRATDYFEDNVGRSLTLDLNDLDRGRWSLVPQPGDFIAEVRTRRFGGLTYARLMSEPEDVTLFDRRRKKNISLYASEDKLAQRGRFYSEDDAVDYDLDAIDLETDVDPDRFWVEGRATLTLRTRTALSSLTIKLADPLAVRSAVSDELGRLLFLRIVGQNSVILNLPAVLAPGTPLTVHLTYGGRLVPPDLYTEAAALPAQGQTPEAAEFLLTPEPRLVYSTRSYWYPQSQVPDYATAHLRISVPPEYGVVASGAPAGPPAPAPGPVPPGQRAHTAYVFEAKEPTRYLACVISRFEFVSDTRVELTGTATGPGTSEPVPGDGDEAGAGGTALALNVQASPRQVSRAREVADRASNILKFYTSLLGDPPYPQLTIAVSEFATPGGHSPAYLAILNQPPPLTPLVWRNDPVSFPGYPAYFLAHELAHQWWGQGVGWKNYHEQWISEGFAQYFAALYAERTQGAGTFTDILRQMQRSAIDASAQGPISLGYRLGHIRSDGRVFRAVLYNKSAMVLHMLRRLLGDQPFFDGLRRFAEEFRFRKAGTDDFRQAMEEASGRDLHAFMDAWILGSAIPRLKVSQRVSDGALTITIEQVGEVLPVPLTATLLYTDGSRDDLVLPVTEPRFTRTVPLRGPLRDVKFDEDHAALARIEK
jgi:hypothetical protein